MNSPLSFHIVCRAAIMLHLPEQRSRISGSQTWGGVIDSEADVHVAIYII